MGILETHHVMCSIRSEPVVGWLKAKYLGPYPIYTHFPINHGGFPINHGGFPINHGGFPINHGGIFSDFRGSSQSFPHPVTKKSEKHSQSNRQKCFIYVQLGILGTLKNECNKNIVSSRRSLKNQSVKTRRILASPMILAVDMASTLSGCTWRYAVNKLVYEHIWLQVYPASAPVCL